jgi:hypothetical protein
MFENAWNTWNTASLTAIAYFVCGTVVAHASPTSPSTTGDVDGGAGVDLPRPSFLDGRGGWGRGAARVWLRHAREGHGGRPLR